MNAFGSAQGCSELDFCRGAAALIATAGEGISSILPYARRKKAHMLFKAYDSEEKGFVDTPKFTTLCKQYDPNITQSGVAKTFEMVGATGDKIDIVAFYR